MVTWCVTRHCTDTTEDLVGESVCVCVRMCVFVHRHDCVHTKERGDSLFRERWCGYGAEAITLYKER